MVSSTRTSSFSDRFPSRGSDVHRLFSPAQGGTDEPTRRVSLLLESVELLFQLDRKLNNDANKLGHDQNPRWVE